MADAPENTQPDEQSESASAPAPVAPNTPAPDPRPRPAYGEYAPEGWEWKPEAAAQAPAAAERPVAGNSGGGSASPHTAPPAVPGSVPGVPHNLGAGSKLPGRGSRAGAQAGSSDRASQAGAPYRGDAPAQSMMPKAPQAPQGTPGARPGQPFGTPTSHPVDRVFTVLLLVLGAFGAVQSSFAMMGLETAFKIMGEAPGVGTLTIPSWLGVTTKVIGVAILAIYGMMLVYTIRRLRAGKLTFWVPLVTGVVVTIAVVVVVVIAFFNTPELMQVLSDPDKANALLDYVQGVGQP